MRSHFISTALEAIQFKHSKEFFNELTELVGSLRASANPSDSPVLGKISKLITKHTNIKNGVVMVKSFIPNASVFFPLIERNHPLLNKFQQQWEGINAQGKAIAKHDIDAIGYVDLAGGKVFGIYQDVPIGINLTTGLFKGAGSFFGNKTPIDDGEIASIILHEIGHVFGYFEYLGSRVGRNLAMVTIVQRVFGKETTLTEKTLLLNEAKAALRLASLDTDRAAASKTKTELQLVLVDAEASRLRSEVGTDFYDMTSFEYLADQYATNQGAGISLITGLSKIHRGAGDLAFSSNLKFAIFESAKLLVFIAYSVWTVGILPVIAIYLGITINPMTSTYDTPKERFRRIRQTLVGELSNVKSNAERKALLEDIKIIDVVLEDVNDRKTIYQYVFTTLVKSHKYDLDQQQIQKDLEAIGMNDLFVSAARLQTLL
jgi:hypothetical protein